MSMHDVLVIGAGPGGAAAAHYLAKAGADVLLLDRAAFPRDKTCGDGLTPRAVGILQDMGLLEALEPLGRRISRFEVVAPNRKTTAAPIPISGGLPPFSLVVPRLALDAQVLGSALARGAQFEPGVHIDDLAASADGVEARGTAAGKQVTHRARLAVIATGAHSRLLMNIGVLAQAPQTMVATRAYFENVRDLTDTWQLRFDGVQLPGYGWVFPTGDGTANIGAGFFATQRTRSAQQAFESFIANPALAPLLKGARQTGPARGFPLRADFTTSRTHGPRMLLVGEAAGLVNPLTGEGIDYALESGKIAAGHIMRLLAEAAPGAAGDPGQPAHPEYAAYDAALRAQYQALFEFCLLLRDRFCDKAWLLNLLVTLANQRADLRSRLAQVVLGGAPMRGKLTAGRVARALLRPVSSG